MNAPTLTAAQVNAFIHDGFVRVDNAFPAETAAAGRAILWRDTGCDPTDRSTRTRPVVRLGAYDQLPFAEPLRLDRDGAFSPVEDAIRQALS